MEIREVLEKVYYPERGIRKRVIWLEECLGRCDVVSDFLSECGDSCELVYVNVGEDSDFVVFVFDYLFVRIDKKNKRVYNWWFKY